jgi:hypothetical protein
MWKIWEKFRNKSGHIYMVRYSHGKCYAWEIWDVGSNECHAEVGRNSSLQDFLMGAWVSGAFLYKGRN